MYQHKTSSLLNQGALAVDLFYTPTSTSVEVLLLRGLCFSIRAHQEMLPQSPFRAQALYEVRKGQAHGMTSVCLLGTPREELKVVTITPSVLEAFLPFLSLAKIILSGEDGGHKE